MAIGDRLKDSVTLWGAASCINTAKCLMTAGEKGMDIRVKAFDPESPDVKSMTPLGVGPVIRHVDFVVVGQLAIMSYLDDKGFGPSLVIRNGVWRAIQYQWTQYAIEVVQPNIDDGQALENCFAQLENHFQNLLPAQKSKGFICGDFSLADIHWAACANMMDIQGKSNIISKHSNVSQWWSRVKEHPSTSKESLTPFTCMPTASDVSSNTLRDIKINN